MVANYSVFIVAENSVLLLPIILHFRLPISLHFYFPITGRRLKTFKIKEKILKLIEDSAKLLDLVKNPVAFVEEILEVRHYIVHEANPSSLDLYNNEIKLRGYNMKLKVILEYYLLMDIGFDGEYLDTKVHRTLVNMAQFRL